MTNNWKQLHKRYEKEDWVKIPSIFAQQVIEYFPLEGALLELGAGLGQDGLYFAEHGYHVTSTDLEIESLTVAIKANKPLRSKIDIEKVDLEEPLQFDDEQFDIVYAHLSLHYFSLETTITIFEEIYRILKPGGIVAFFTNSTDDPEYGTGEKIEEDYFNIEGVPKRYFSPETANRFAAKFSTILSDNNGETYKDSAKDIHNLIRFIGKRL